MPSTRVFISYRRADSGHQTGRVFDHLESVFGRPNVFKDVDSIPAGSDFRQVLEDAVVACDVLLVVIGDQWLTVTDKQGRRRLDRPDDFVRLEVEAALKRGIPIIPVLVGSAGMPSDADLPAEIRPLAFRNAVFLRPDPDFRNDIKKLVASVKSAAEFNPGKFHQLRSRLMWAWRVAMVCCLIAVLAGFAAVSLAMRPAIQQPPASVPQDFEAIPSATTIFDRSMEFELDGYEGVTKQTIQKREVEKDGKRTTEDVPVTFKEYVLVRSKLRIEQGDTVRLYKTRFGAYPYLLVIENSEPKSTRVLLCPNQPQISLPPVEPPKHLPPPGQLPPPEIAPKPNPV